MKKMLTFLLALAFILVVFTGCSSEKEQMPAEEPETSEEEAETPAEEAPAEETPTEEETSDGEFDGTVKIALITTLTGDNSLNGEYAQHGFEMAVEEINEAGGILGKEVIYELFDEMSTAEGAVSAFAKLAEDDEIMVVDGSHMSIYAVACMNDITKSGIPYVSNGSSSTVDDEKNPLVWQSRPLDIYQGVAMAQAAVDQLDIKNPAILYSTDSTYVSLMERTVAAYKDLYDIEIGEENLFAFAESETNFANYIAQIMNGDFDGVIEISGQNPCILIMQQGDAAGLDLPRIGFNAVGDTSTLDNAGSAADGWYCISDWVPSVDTETGAAFTKKFEEKYGNTPATSGAYAYDTVYIIKAAMEAAGTTTDRAAINAGFEKISNLVGAAGTYSYYEENHSFASSIFLSYNENGSAVCKEIITFR